MRQKEVSLHLQFIGSLEAAAKARKAEGSIDAEHVNIVKSALLVHLYNVVEAVMAMIVNEVASEARAHAPPSWTDGVFHAWIRHRSALAYEEVGGADRISRIVDVIAEATGRKALGSTAVARLENNWAHEQIEAVAQRLGCDLTIDEPIRVAACVRFFVDNHPPMKYVRHMRNQLGHGNVSFVDAGAALSFEQLQFLSNTLGDYMRGVVVSFVAYLDGKRYLRPPAA